MKSPLNRTPIFAATLVGIMLISFSALADEPFVPNTNLNVKVPRCTDEIRIDGRLDDPMWKNAAKLENFTEAEPRENARPAVRTEAYIAYDDENLYFAFKCYDDPSTIRANITDRDNMFSDDFIGIMIDTFRDQQNGYEFFVNPYGIQGDLRRTRNNEDSSYDTVWESAAQITDFGWTAEIALPFRSLRFPDAEEQEWGLHVLRVRPRESREQISWAPMSRDENCMFCQAGKMTGLEGIAQSRNLEILPYALGSQSGGLSDNDEWANESATGDAGFGIKYGLTSNYTADLTYNPDFSQIEADASQIDANNKFALFFPERRPFFLEGNDIFDSKINAVYTRSINTPIGAGKLTGKSGRTTVGFMTALDEDSPFVVPFEESSGYTLGGRSFSNIARVKRDVLEDSYVGLMATDRRMENGNGSNTTAGADWRIQLGEVYGFEAQVLGSHTQEPNDPELSEDFGGDTFGKDDEYTSDFDGEDFTGYALETSFNRRARHYNFWAWYEDYSPTFRADNGFIRGNNFRKGGFWNGYTFQFDENPVVERIEPQLGMGRAFNHQGQFKDEWFNPSIFMRFKKQTGVWSQYTFSNEVFADSYVGGIRRWQANVWTQFSSLLSGGTYWRLGKSIVRDSDDPRLGDEKSFDVWATIRPTSQFQWRVNYNSFKISEIGGESIYDVFIVRNRLTCQFTRKLFLRVITEYVDVDKTKDSDASKDISVDPLLSYKINPFTVFFIGTSHSMSGYPASNNGIVYRQTDRVFFVKFQYLFRV